MEGEIGFMSTNQYISPRIGSLAEQISIGNNESINLFWTRIFEEGAPLIEEIDGDKDNLFITFLYKDDQNVSNVLIYGAFPGFRYSENIMERLLGTNILFKTYKVRNDVKFKYNLSTNYEFDDDYNKITSKSIIDPLNPNKVVFIKDEEDPESSELINSFVVLPNSKKDIWTIPSNRINWGQIELHKYYSEALNNTRRIWVYTPFSYGESNKSCNLLVLTDGFDYINYLSAKEVLDNLIHATEIPPTVCIFVDSSSNRYEELTCSESFSNFVAKELMPWVHKNYNVAKDPDRTTIGGFSLGGLASAYIGLKNSDLFGKVISQSASFWWEAEWLVKEFEKTSKLPLKFYLNVGFFEGRPYDDEPVMMDSIDNMKNVLLSIGYEVSYEHFQSGHDYLSWGETLANGLIALTGKKEANAQLSI